jgi:succinyl-CoA synthetase alpha subunit
LSILLDARSRVCVQGITGVGGRVHALSMLEYGTQVVAGVSPGHGGEAVNGIPVFDTCQEAVNETGATFSVCFVGGHGARDAILEAIYAGIRTAVCMEEFVPLLDAVQMRRISAIHNVALIGPNCNGIISPGKAKVGFFPREFGHQGPVGIASRSGTMTYGTMMAVESVGVGESTVVGIGGASVKGIGFVDCLQRFAEDDETEVVVLVGEIGGVEEESAAAFIARGYPKPVVALISGRVAPEGVAMGHAGAIATANRGTWKTKVAALRDVGVDVVSNLEELGERVAISVRRP